MTRFLLLILVFSFRAAIQNFDLVGLPTDVEAIKPNLCTIKIEMEICMYIFLIGLSAEGLELWTHSATTVNSKY